MPQAKSSPLAILLTAAVLGGAVGVGSLALTDQGGAKIKTVTREHRSRPPQPGDVWRGCNDARAAGTAPIYNDEPGYSPNMDGDSDGIACEAVS